MVRKNLKTAVLAFIVGILFATSTATVFAATATSSWGYYGPYLGYSYKNQAMVSDNVRLYASTTAANQATGNVPTGYMGAKAMLYNSSNQLIDFTSWYYNNGPANSLSVPTLGSGFSSGTYYSKGMTAAYNGNGYNQYYTFQSPNINH